MRLCFIIIQIFLLDANYKVLGCSQCGHSPTRRGGPLAQPEQEEVKEDVERSRRTTFRSKRIRSKGARRSHKGIRKVERVRDTTQKHTTPSCWPIIGVALSHLD